MAKAYSAEKSGDALLVWVDGELVLEDYPNEYDPDDPHILTEASTLLTSLGVLAAVGDGVMALDERAARTITEWRDDPQKADITIGQLAQMTSGLDANARSGDLTIGTAIATPMAHAPGEGFRYGPAPVQVLGDILRRKTDGGLRIGSLLKAMDIPGGLWVAVSASAEANAARGGTLTPRWFDGANMTPRHFGRIGQLLLQDGRWDGEPLIENIRPLTRPSAAQPAYGMGVWRNAPMDSVGTAVFDQLPESLMLPRTGERFIYDGAPGSLYMAAGRYNQRLYVIPSRGMVVVRMGRANLTWSDADFLARLLDGRTSDLSVESAPSGE
jgi:CubicO group peptidase (beta-lactamase class C family)